MPCQMSLTLLPREAEDFSGGGNHSGHMPLLTYPAWLQPIYYNSRFAFIHINITKVFTCGENFDKKKIIFFQVQFSKIRLLNRSATTLISQQPWKDKAAAATLISNHKLQNNCSLKKYISEHKYKNYVNSCEFMWIYG